MDRLILVDVGNTDIKHAIAESDGAMGPVVRGATANVELIAQEIADYQLDVALSCVRAGASEPIRNALASKGKRLLFEVNAEVAQPVSGFYKGMGADRIADLAAAFSHFRDSGGPTAVVGLGTGTTITAVSAKGNFCGAYSALGLGAACQALTLALPALPAIDPTRATSVEPGDNVYDALCRGTVLGHVGLVEKWIHSFKKQFGHDLAVAATGGWSRLIGSLSDQIEWIEPELTLRGIWILATHADCR